MTLEEKHHLNDHEIHRQKKLNNKRIIALKESIKETDSKKMNISSFALDLLEELGFKRNDKGTVYLSTIIEAIYHERKAFDKEQQVFDLNDENNLHYSFPNEYYECGLVNLKKRIAEAIKTSFLKDSSMNDIVYGVVNDIISQIDRNGQQLIYKR